jgi:hypothetical protein
MPIATTTALALGAAGAFGASAAKKALTKKPSTALGGEAPIAPAMPQVIPGEIYTAASEAARKQRKRAIGDGRRATILTGPQGLMSEPSTSRTTLLGGMY